MEYGCRHETCVHLLNIKVFWFCIFRLKMILIFKQVEIENKVTYKPQWYAVWALLSLGHMIVREKKINQQFNAKKKCILILDIVELLVLRYLFFSLQKCQISLPYTVYSGIFTLDYITLYHCSKEPTAKAIRIDRKLNVQICPWVRFGFTWIELTGHICFHRFQYQWKFYAYNIGISTGYGI